MRGEVTEEKIHLGACITARYGKSHVLPISKVSVRQAKNDTPQRFIEVTPMGQEEADKLILKKISAGNISHKSSPATEFNIG